MQLSEKEIEGMVATAVAKCFVYALGNTEGLEGKTRNVVKQAAHAIAEKMREGVVADFEGRWRIDEVGHYFLSIQVPAWWNDERIDIEKWLSQIGDNEGQLVTVTVTKAEEKDGQDMG